MGRNKYEVNNTIILGRRNNEVKNNTIERTTKVVLKNGQTEIVLKSTTVGNLAKHNANVKQQVAEAVKIVETLELAESLGKRSDSRPNPWCKMDEFCSSKSIKIANEIVLQCIRNRESREKANKSV